MKLQSGFQIEYLDEISKGGFYHSNTSNIHQPKLDDVTLIVTKFYTQLGTWDAIDDLQPLMEHGADDSTQVHPRNT